MSGNVCTFAGSYEDGLKTSHDMLALKKLKIGPHAPPTPPNPFSATGGSFAQPPGGFLRRTRREATLRCWQLSGPVATWHEGKAPFCVCFCCFFRGPLSCCCFFWVPSLFLFGVLFFGFFGIGPFVFHSPGKRERYFFAGVLIPA